MTPISTCRAGAERRGWPGVRLNVDNMMLNGGRAQFNATRVRVQIEDAGGPDIGIPGTQPAAYEQVYVDFELGKLTEAQAVAQAAQLMANETISAPPYIPYRDAYRRSFEEEWDKRLALLTLKFHVRSATRPFTAVAVLILQEQGQLEGHASDSE